MLKERVLSAIVLIALVLCALFLFTPFYFALALGFVATLGIWEWAQFARFKNPLARLCIAAFLGAFIFLWLYNEGNYLDAGRVFENYLPLFAHFLLYSHSDINHIILYRRSNVMLFRIVLLQNSD